MGKAADTKEQIESVSPRRAGRPTRGTEKARNNQLIAAATRLFLREGYVSTSINKVAREAGVSTRTIYGRFKNKSELLSAVVSGLVRRDIITVLSPKELERLEPREALLTIGLTIVNRARNPDVGALFRILAIEAQRFPDLAETMRVKTRVNFNAAIEQYFRAQILRSKLKLHDPASAASVFMNMICAEIHEKLFFGRYDEVQNVDSTPHVRQVVDIFLFGAVQGEAPEPTSFQKNSKGTKL